MARRRHTERHRVGRVGWLRAAVLVRVAFSGAFAMAVTAGVGALFGTAVS